MSEKEEKVFKQEVSVEEMNMVAGAGEDEYNCVSVHRRDIEEGGFPNCAATVEDWSWCNTNDACMNHAVKYYGMVRCIYIYR